MAGNGRTVLQRVAEEEKFLHIEKKMYEKFGGYRKKG